MTANPQTDDVVEWYPKKDFGSEFFDKCPEINLEQAVEDTILPEKFISTTNLPTYVKYHGKWRLSNNPRMDTCLCYDPQNGEFINKEMKKVKKGELVAVSRSQPKENGAIIVNEDGSEGFYVDRKFNSPQDKEKINGNFMGSEVSRERPIIYRKIAEQLHYQKKNRGHVIWVLGPAIVHTNSIPQVSWLIEYGYIDVLFSGNAIAVHDVETSLFGTALGAGSEAGDHASHMRAIQKIKKAGSIEKLVESGGLNKRKGIMYSCVKNKVPYILAGSIRDDGPLPETITDTQNAQDIMRTHTKKATGVVMAATTLHSIATGNMLPAYYEKNGLLYNMLTVCIDQEEFVVNKLKDRGTHQAFGVVTNAQDAIFRIYHELEKIENKT